MLLMAGSELYHSGTLTTYSDGPTKISATGYVRMNPDDAIRLEVVEGERVLLATGAAEMTVPVRISTDIRPGTLFAPIHFADAPVLALSETGGPTRVRVRKV